jgi:hypothetical protein
MCLIRDGSINLDAKRAASKPFDVMMLCFVRMSFRIAMRGLILPDDRNNSMFQSVVKCGSGFSALISSQSE